MRFTRPLLILGALLTVRAAPAGEPGKIPITTTSEEARKLYLEARDLAEKLRGTDAHTRYLAAVAKDPSFALAHLGASANSTSAQEFFDELGKAVALADKVSETERLWIKAVDSGAHNDPAGQLDAFKKLVAAMPGDERAHNLLAGVYFGRLDYAEAIAEYNQAIQINPSFSQPYNQLGYAYRFVEKYPEAEATFKKYIELIPNDPNPYDSYAELLMKIGKFDESIKSYRKALAIDPNFIASYVGIGNDQMFMGQFAEARKSFAKLLSASRNDGEKRTAIFWTAVSYIHEGQTDKALAEVQKEATIAEASKDLANLAADHNLMGNILLDGGRADQAVAEFAKQLEINARANVPAELKAAAQRNARFDRARVALARKDLAAAKAESDAYTKEVADRKVPFEVRQAHELAGIVAVAAKDYATATAELEAGNLQDPRVLYYLALAYQGKGDAERAKTFTVKAAKWNALGLNYAYTRKKATDLLAKTGS